MKRPDRPYSGDFNPAEIARISAALAEGVANAQAVVEARDLGPDLLHVVRHGRELHGLLLEQMVAAEPHVGADLRAMSDEMHGALLTLEELDREPDHVNELAKSRSV